MILAIDIGNTNIVVGCIDEEKIYFTERLSTVRTKTELEYAVDLKTVLDIYHIKRTDIEGCIIFFSCASDYRYCKTGSRENSEKRGYGAGAWCKDWFKYCDG